MAPLYILRRTGRLTWSSAKELTRPELASPKPCTLLTFITERTWLVGNRTICLSVNVSTAPLLAACISLFHPDFIIRDWQLLLFFYATTSLTFLIVAFGNRFLPIADTLCSVLPALALVTAVQMALGPMGIGSATGFLAFFSVRVKATGFAVPIVVGMLGGRREVRRAR